MLFRCVVLVGLLCAAVAQRKKADTGLTQKEVDALELEIRELITNTTDDRGFKTFIGGFVRLTFHDCVGGCDGCVHHLNNEHNRGLKTYIDALESVYSRNGVSTLLSRADFWALAGVVALKMGAETSRSPSYIKLTYKWGRKDCTKIGRDHFPDATKGLDHVLEFFRNEFNFTAKEVTALMGAHTLGKARPWNSGFRGPWVGGQDHLNNAYYRDLVRGSWQQHNVARRRAPPKWQWSNNGRFMMLNVDMCLARTIKVDDDGRDTCQDAGADCSGAPETAEFVAKYAKRQHDWLRDFAAVFTKMIEHKSENLREPL